MEQICRKHQFIPDSIAFSEDDTNAIMILSCTNCYTVLEVSRKDLSPIDQETFDYLAKKRLRITMKDRIK
jgi:phosphotransferase system IIB component